MLRSCIWLCMLPLLVTSSTNHFKLPLLYNGNVTWSKNRYYEKCAPKVTCNPNAVYRTINGSCNNLVNPLWGSSITPFIRLLEADFADGDHEIRTQSDGSPLPGPREVHLTLFLHRSRDFSDVYNYHVNQFGQWSAHDITLMPPINEGPDNCCELPVDNNTPYQCQAVINIPENDPVYGKSGRRCMEFRRARTASFNYNCKITPQIPTDGHFKSPNFKVYRSNTSAKGDYRGIQARPQDVLGDVDIQFVVEFGSLIFNDYYISNSEDRNDSELKQCFTKSFYPGRNFEIPIYYMNRASPFIDASQLYGHTPSKAATLRTYKDGKLNVDIINGHEFCPLLKRNQSLICDGRDNVRVCFDGGDPRLNQHFGLTIYQTMFTRFHNFMASWFQYLNPKWSDEKLYQEVRKFIGAASQILIYRDYLPILLGKSFTNSNDLALRVNKRTKYNPSIMPQLSIEFSGSTFRTQHNIMPKKYNFVDNHYNIMNSVKLNEWMSIPDPLVEKSNFDDVLRGMATTPGRAPSPSYNYMISNFMSHFFIIADQDLLSIDIQRGREIGVPTYNNIREKCGFPRASSFDDLSNILSKSDISQLKTLYATVDDVDLLVGALLEPPCPEAMVGPTARCIIAESFYRVRYGDRFFFDVDGQPGSFSQKQIDALRKIDLGHVFCAASGLGEVPIDIFRKLNPRFSTIQDCHSHLSTLDLSAWKKTR